MVGLWAKRRRFCSSSEGVPERVVDLVGYYIVAAVPGCHAMLVCNVFASIRTRNRLYLLTIRSCMYSIH